MNSAKSRHLTHNLHLKCFLLTLTHLTQTDIFINKNHFLFLPRLSRRCRKSHRCCPSGPWRRGAVAPAECCCRCCSGCCYCCGLLTHCSKRLTPKSSRILFASQITPTLSPMILAFSNGLYCCTEAGLAKENDKLELQVNAKMIQLAICFTLRKNVCMKAVNET